MPKSLNAEEVHSVDHRVKEQQASKILYFLCEYVTQKGVYFGRINYLAKEKQIQFRSLEESQRP